MHSYRKLIEEQMKAGDMSQAELARASGITPQRISQILKDDRDRLVQVPDTKTVEGFAEAFTLEPEVVWIAVAEAMGLPRFVVPSITHQIEDADEIQLLKALASRMGLEVTVRTAKPAPSEDQKMTPPTLIGVAKKKPAGERVKKAARRKTGGPSDKE